MRILTELICKVSHPYLYDNVETKIFQHKKIWLIIFYIYVYISTCIEYVLFLRESSLNYIEYIFGKSSLKDIRRIYIEYRFGEYPSNLTVWIYIQKSQVFARFARFVIFSKSENLTFIYQKVKFLLDLLDSSRYSLCALFLKIWRI